MPKKNTSTSSSADKVTIKGIITAAFKGSTQHDKSTKLHLSIKFDEGQKEKLVDICNERGIFAKAKEAFIPKWYTDEKAEYINFKSIFEIPAGYKAENGTVCQMSLEDMLADFGSITGSHAVISLTLKEGAVYARAVAIDDLQTADFSEMFGDENPFT